MLRRQRPRPLQPRRTWRSGVIAGPWCALLGDQPAASASAARPIHCDRSAPDGKRAEPFDRRSSDDEPRGVRAAAARRRCGVSIGRWVGCRMVGLSVLWSCDRGKHGASQARDGGAASMPWPSRQCGVRSFTRRHAYTDAACEAHNIAIQREQTAAVFARPGHALQTAKSVRAEVSKPSLRYLRTAGTATSGRSFDKLRTIGRPPFDTSSGRTGLTPRVCSLLGWQPATAACRPRAARRGFVPHSPARQRRHLSSPALRR